MGFIILQHSYKYSLLRNFNDNKLKHILSTKINGFDEEFESTNGTKYERIREVLNDMLGEGYDDENIEEAFFKYLVFKKPERTYISTLSTKLTVGEALNTLSKSNKFSHIIDRKITKIIKSNDELVSIRRYENQIVFLFKLGEAEVGKDKEKCAFYVPCILNFKNKTWEFRVNQHLMRNTSNMKLRIILQKIKTFIDTSLTLEAYTEEEYKEADIHYGLYSMFVEESERSLKLVKNEVDKSGDLERNEAELKESISKYLKKDLKINNPNSFINNVLSLRYQDKARDMDIKQFINDGGYIFGFTFADKDITKSTNRNEDHEPVYYSKIFWSLKEVVSEYEEISELGMYWKFDRNQYNRVSKNQEDNIFTEVALRETLNILEIHYYYDGDDLTQDTILERRIKEDYVIQKVNKHIFTK